MCHHDHDFYQRKTRFSGCLIFITNLAFLTFICGVNTLTGGLH